MTKKSTGLIVPASEESLALLRQDYPVELGFSRTLLPRFGMVSQDVTEGKGKSMKVVTEAGTFYTEHQTEEEDEEGKKKWERTELGDSAEGIILFQRKQLKYYDKTEEVFTSSPIFDTEDEVLPLFKEKKEVERGLPSELRKLYPGTNSKGKPMSQLEDNLILYVLMDDEIFQLNIRGTSMYSFKGYSRKTLPPSVITRFTSEAKENGSTQWNMMTFDSVRPLGEEEVQDVRSKVAEIKDGIAQEKAYFASLAPSGEQSSAQKQVDEDAKKW